MPAVTPAEVDTALANEDRVGVHTDLGVELRERRGMSPVGGRAEPVKQPGFGEQEGAAADRGGAPGGPGEALDATDEPLVRGRGADADPAGDDQRVEALDLADRGVRPEAEPARAADVLAVGGDAEKRWDVTGVEARRVQHLPGPGDIERLDAIEGDEADARARGT